MNTTRSLSAIILAGGSSSRMGRDKALITLQGVPLLRQICDVALHCTHEVYVVTPWPERYQEILPEGCRVIQEVPMPGENQNHGPLVGFAQGLAQVETDWVLLLACDLPQLKVEVLQGWVAELSKFPVLTQRSAKYTAEERKEDGGSFGGLDTIERCYGEVGQGGATIALLPRNPKGWEPLCGFYRRQCLPMLTRFINQGGRSFQLWLAQHSVQELLVSDPEMFFNCNTPADLESIGKISSR